MMASGPGFWASVRRRRRWSEEDKARIVAECEAPGSSVSLVARRHDLNTNLLFCWRRRLRGQQCTAGAVGFVPAVIAPQESAGDRVTELRREPSPDLSSGADARPSGRIEIVLGEPRRIIVEDDVDVRALARVIGVLEGR
jgi:transposase